MGIPCAQNVTFPNFLQNDGKTFFKKIIQRNRKIQKKLIIPSLHFMYFCMIS